MEIARQDILTIEGMFCAACAASIEAVLVRQPGVANAQVNFAADAAVVEWQAGDYDVRPLLDAVGRLGYETRLVGDEAAGARRSMDTRRDLALRLVVALFFGMWAMLPSIALYFDAVANSVAGFYLALSAGLFSLPVVCYSGLPFYRMGVATLRNGVAGIDALITIGVAGSLVLSATALLAGTAAVYFEVAVALITLQLVARLLDLRVRRKAREAVIGLLELAPEKQNVVQPDGTVHAVVVGAVAAGDTVRIAPGERLAIDGKVERGRAQVDRSLLTGETSLSSVQAGTQVHAGERVVDASIDVVVMAAVGQRRLDLLARQVRATLAARPPWQRAADLLARYFLWLSTLAALLGAALVAASGGTAAEAAVRALAVFVIACPCSLSLAAPVAGLVTSAAAARRGIILRDLNAVTSAAVPRRLFLDKTGTLTLGRPTVTAVHPAGHATRSELLCVAATAEHAVEHPIARALTAAAELAGACDIDPRRLAATGKLYQFPGCGVRWRGNDERIDVGSLDWLLTLGIELPQLPSTNTTRCGVARNGRLLGVVDLTDTLRPGIEDVIQTLRSRGLEPVILSGDGAAPVAAIAARLGCEAHANLSPEEKVQLIEDSRRAGWTTAFAGDGINDAPALAAADLGVAVGAATDAARSAAAVSFVEADVTALPALFDLTGRARAVIRQNLAWAVAYNVVAIPAALAGWVHPAVAAGAMALSSISVVLNALRAGERRPVSQTGNERRPRWPRSRAVEA